jgi:two-component system response regulator HydG
MREVLAKAARVAPQDTSVVITGETGVGKDWLAHWIHEHSRRVGREFVPVNCAAFPDTLLDTHLFGHARGAFTGAVEDARGIFEVAAGGTLFLDEVGEVSPAMQAKLLRVLQEREVRRVGEWRRRRIDVRFIAATNRHLEDEMAAGRFRRDLFHRLHVVGLHIPPLRERPGELRILARELVERTATRLGCPVRGFASDAWACLVRHEWPGNVRELEHAIEEACLAATGSEIRFEDLPHTIRDQVPRAPSARPELRPLADLQHSYIQAVLKRHRGNRRAAADELLISMSTLKRKLRRGRLA